MRIELVTRVAKHDNDELNELLDQYKKLEKTKAELDEQIKQLKAKAEEYAGEQKTFGGRAGGASENGAGVGQAYRADKER